MTLETFFEKSYFLKQNETRKVALLFYYYLKTEGLSEFSTKHVLKWFENLNLPKPNNSRLNANIVKSKLFITTKKGVYKLHLETILNFDTLFPELLHTDSAPTLKNEKLKYIDISRIQEINKIQNNDFDLSKLLKTCDEINICHTNQCYLSLIMLVRSLIDHIPPIFGMSSFSQVTNNYSGTKSFKESMEHLSSSSRKIADQYLHSQIRKKESLPTKTQVDFSNDIDVLLAEIIRILK